MPEGIRIYLRLRPPATAQQSRLLGGGPSTSSSLSAQQQQQIAFSAENNAACAYDVEHTFDASTVRFQLDRRATNEVINNSTDSFRFRFRRVFETSSGQEEVFNAVAKDCVLSSLNGYNSTIFAYGQTGSGKTYSITGGTGSYQERGIIPRALALVYEEVAKRKEFNWTVSLSYLQIYNDKGQDLLNHGNDARSLEELPPVTVHELDDDVLLKGLEQHFAPTLTDALNLLFLGDTNRLYCETPMNKTSSRSHCVFTISLEARAVGSAVVRRSKLNLVDLAGSERVSKTGVGGTLLTEAKYINLSLHYLEQVIIALSEQAKGKRDHVPFRNSFMTMVLRDSLGGNCRTSMLATAHVARGLLGETLSTCQFAQRVALIRQDAHVNEETDPLVLVRKLKAEVAQLKDQLAFCEQNHGGGSGGADRVLTDDERARCRELVRGYVHNEDPAARFEGFGGDLARIYCCFDIMKQLARGASSGSADDAGGNRGGRSAGQQGNRRAEEEGEEQDEDDDYDGNEERRTLEAEVRALQVSLQAKENEVNTLLGMLQGSPGAHSSSLSSAAAAAVAVARFNVETQIPTGATTGGSLEDGTTTSSLDIIQQQRPVAELIAELRRRAARGATIGTASSNAVRVPNGAAVTASGSVDTVRAHVVGLAESGKLNEAQATAVSEFLAQKAAHLAESYNLSALSDAELVHDRTAAFEAFKQSYRHYAKVEAAKAELKGKYETCKATAARLNQCVDGMKQIKLQVQRRRAERAVDGIEEADAEERELLNQLATQKATYNTTADELRRQKEEIDGMHAFMKRAQDQLARDFKEWLEVRQRQVRLAVNRGATSSSTGEDTSTATRFASAIGPSLTVPTATAALPQPVSHSALSSGQAASSLSSEAAPSRPTAVGKATDARAAPFDGGGVTGGEGGGEEMNIVSSSNTAVGGGSGTVGSARPPPPPPHPSSSGTVVVGAAGSARGGGWMRSPGSPVLAPLPSRPTASPTVSAAAAGNSSPNSGVAGTHSAPLASSSTLAAMAPTPTADPLYSVAGGVPMAPSSRVLPRLQPLSSSGTLPSRVGQPTTTASAPPWRVDTGEGVARSASLSVPSETASSSVRSEFVPLSVTIPTANPYAPEHRSTGNAAADAQLAALYKAREAMRAQFQ